MLWENMKATKLCVCAMGEYESNKWKFAQIEKSHETRKQP